MFQGPTLTWQETQYQELWGAGYPQETLSGAASAVQEATRVYLVDWESRNQAVWDFLGTADVETITSGNQQLSRNIPHYHADYQRPDGSYFLWADTVTLEPFGVPLDDNGHPQFGQTINTDLDTPNYNLAKMTVHYSSRMYKILEDSEMPIYGGAYNGIDESSGQRFVEILSHPQGEYLSLPDGTFTLANSDVSGNKTNVVAGSAVPGAPGKIVAPKDLIFVWRQVPRVMVAASDVMFPVLGADTQPAAFDYAVGRVNQTTFFGCPPETLLCEPMEIVPWTQCDGEMVFDITFHFKYLRTGHNYFLTKNTTNTLVQTQIVADPSGTSYTPGEQTDGQTVYDSYIFQYLFFGYKFSAGVTP